MTLYLDSSVLIALLTNDTFSQRADALVRVQPATLLLSDLAAAEFASTVAKRVRTREISNRKARETFSLVDDWSEHEAQRIQMTSQDIMVAGIALRRLDLTLRTADAIHIAIAQRLSAMLATFDVKMAACAQALGVSVAA